MNSIVEQVIRDAFPNAVILETAPAPLPEPSASLSPEVQALVRKYAGPRRGPQEPTTAAPAEGDTLVACTVRLGPSVGLSPLQERLARRTLIVDTVSRSIVGTSG